MRILVALIAIFAVGCATKAPEKPAGDDAEKVMTERIDRICSLPPDQRDAELEKLKKETGLVLYCGKTQ